MDEVINRLIETFASKARNARKTECVPEYQAYWRGYATALDEAAEALDRIKVDPVEAGHLRDAIVRTVTTIDPMCKGGPDAMLLLRAAAIFDRIKDQSHGGADNGH